MTNKRKTRDLAEKVMGWTFAAGGWWQDVSTPKEKMQATGKWSPSTSRDDAHEVLAKLTDEQWECFTTEISKMLTDKYTLAEVQAATDGQLMKDTLTATPAQISEAVWRAVC